MIVIVFSDYKSTWFHFFRTFIEIS